MNKEELWQAALAQIQLTISPANFATWFRNTEISSYENRKIVISTPNTFVREWLEKKYHKMIFKILSSLDENIKEIEYKETRSGLKTNLKLERKIPNQILETEQLSFQDFRLDRGTNLNPRYTFENFIVGPFNELAQAAAWAVSQNPGSVYNPLFVYGGVGLGKTHLLQAIGNEILKTLSSKKIRYLPTEKLASEIINAIRNRNIENLKNKLNQIDVLILDDVQFLSGKEKTQEEFFYIFNTLYEKNKQIVLSSDRLPKAIPALTERLRSRFEGGMIADIGYPDYETRIAILKAKAQEKGVEFSDEVLSYIANNIKKNIRELEGALNRLIAYQKIQAKVPDLETTKTLLKNLIQSPKTILTPQKVLQVIAEFYDLKEKDLLSPSRKREIVRPRQIAMYLLREELKCSFPFIAQKLGGKDHTTVIHAFEKISKELSLSESLTEEINLIKQNLANYY